LNAGSGYSIRCKERGSSMEWPRREREAVSRKARGSKLDEPVCPENGKVTGRENLQRNMAERGFSGVTACSGTHPKQRGDFLVRV